MGTVKLSALGTVAFIPHETSLAIICVRSCVDPGGALRLKRISQWIFPVTQPVFQLATFWLEMQCLNQLRHSVPHLNCALEAHYKKEINVNPSLSSIRYQNPNYWYPIYIQISQRISTGSTFKSDQTVCEMQSCVWKWCWGGTWGKMLPSDNLSVCTAICVLFTDTIKHSCACSGETSWITNSAQCNTFHILFVLHYTVCLWQFLARYKK
jgi:hypothetical protein